MHDFAARIAAHLALPLNIIWAGCAIAAVLGCGSIVRLVSLRRAPAADRRKQLGSLAVWWVMYAVVAGTLLAGKIGGAVTFGVLSVVALREFSRLLAQKSLNRTGYGIALLSVPATYAAVVVFEEILYVSIVVVATLICLTIRLVVTSTTSGYLASASSWAWGYMVFVFFLAHAAMLLCLPSPSNRVAGPQGWLVYLILFTECDDIFQALWGRRFGRHKITPVISPHKTWEGFVLGGLTAVGIGALLAPLLTPLAETWSFGLRGHVIHIPYAGVLVAGVLLALSGFFGDLNMSALKRDVGVKDSGNWLPGQGGILDRIDSLTFTAPTFYYFVRLMYD